MLVLLCAMAAFSVLSGCKKAPPTLSLLVWEGYADPSFIQGFEAKCQCKVTAAYMGSSDELVAKLRGGASSNYDVISPSSDVATDAQPVRPGGSARSEQNPELRAAFAKPHLADAG